MINIARYALPDVGIGYAGSAFAVSRHLFGLPVANLRIGKRGNGIGGMRTRNRRGADRTLPIVSAILVLSLDDTAARKTDKCRRQIGNGVVKIVFESCRRVVRFERNVIEVKRARTAESDFQSEIFLF